MSLAILPLAAPMTCSQHSGPALVPPSPAPSKRPKLSLNTTDVPLSVFGKASTSLRLDTLSCTSPTSRNTFSNRNAYTSFQQPPSDSSQQKPVLAPLTTSPTSIVEDECELAQDSIASSASTSSSTSSDFESTEVPYRVAFNTTSILRNGPLPRKRARTSNLPSERTMFPPAKKVAFRSPLTEEVKTTKYIMKHSDIEPSNSSISTLELSPQRNNTESTEEIKKGEQEGAHMKRKGNEYPHAGNKRESSDDEESDDSCPSTPMPGREKRSRIWTWTLGSIDPSSKRQQPCNQPEQAKDKA
ncbi:Hypothetical predicted protein [Lecanosticta acicola]|uniref:Uncharacterized protein n=1 Tax=Lecanosticta acicola TaxID=111012 RepID=A0AAI8Z168_9PEZI|nr:Hypothetical predicted protein [Lecanosticta acicola]